jgi:carboxylesterase
MTLLIPTAEPFFFPHGPVGVLLIHGFTGTPKEMRWMGEHLANQGFTTLGIRLAGHATDPKDMLRVRWRDWLADVECGWRMLHDSCPQVFLAGLSMGGMLALTFASPRHSQGCPVAGVIAMSTPYALKADWRLPYTELLLAVQRQVPKGPPDWRDEAAGSEHVDYPAYPTRAIAELRDLLSEMRRCLPEVKAPVLLVHACTDTGSGGFDAGSMPKLYAALGSQDKEMLWVEDSGHVVTREPERERVFQAAAQFIRRVGKV